MRVLDWQSMKNVPTDGRRVFLSHDTEGDSWSMAPCRYCNGWYLSPNGEVGSPIHFVPTGWLTTKEKTDEASG